MRALTAAAAIAKKILVMRGHRVILSYHLAELYGVEVRALVQAVKRNSERFPPDFMFQLNDGEYADLKSQSVISSWGGRRRANPYAFTEQGVAMLSSVLNSKRAIAVNISIVRTFVRLRQLLAEPGGLERRLSGLERKIGRHDKQIKGILETIGEMIDPGEEPPQVIGFKP